MSTKFSSILNGNVVVTPPVLESLLFEFPGMAYRCLNDKFWSMQYVSPGVKALTGYAPDIFLQDRHLAFSDIIHVDDRQQVQDEINYALTLRSAFAVTYRIVTADGSVKTVAEHGNAIRDSEGSILALQGFVTDVTALQQTQRALDEMTLRFRYIAQATNDAMWDWDLHTNTLWRSNRIHTLLGQSLNEVGSGLTSWTDLVHPEDKNSVLAGLHEVIASKQSEWSAEYRLQRKDGSYADVIDRAFIIRDTHGAATRLVGGISDITERKQSKLYLTRMNRALQILSQCNEQLVHAADENSLVANICRILVETGGYRAASVSFLSKDAQPSLHPAASYGDGLQSLQSLDMVFDTNPVSSDRPDDIAVRSAQAVICSDIATDPALAKWRNALLGSGYRSGIWLPLAHDQHTLGVLTIYLDTVTRFNTDEVQLLRTLAGSMALGVVNIRSLKERKRSELAALKIAAGVTASTGAAFFTELARNMAQAVGANAAFVAQFRDAALASAQTISALVDDRIVPNFEYEMQGSPCERIVQSTNCVVLNDVAGCFPTSGAAKMGMTNYIGCRLDNAAGKPLGLLFVLFRDTVVQPGFVAQTIQIFAARAGAELERRLSDARIQEQASLIDNAKDAIVVHDARNRVTFWNKGAERLYGLSANEVLGMSIDDVVYGAAEHYEAVAANLAERNEWQGEVTCQRQDGSELVVEINSTLVQSTFGNSSSVLSIITDITRRKAAEREVIHIAFHDRVTGLPNRHALVTRLEQLLGNSSNAGNEGALLWIDLDQLKSLNDTRGHDVGDLLLRETAQRIAASIGSGEMAARFGGDEFVVLIASLQGNASHALATAENLVRLLSEPFELENYTHSSSASIGVTFFHCGQDVATEILKRADIAMYEAKAAGGNSVRLFDEKMQKSIDFRVALESDFRCALRDQTLHLAYQPQVSQDGQVIGVEALLRWNHLTRGPISPLEFIPLAEACGLIIPYGKWVLEQACAQLKAWESHSIAHSLSIAVNVSAQQIRHPGFLDQVMDALRRTGADPRKLKLELTESTLVTDADATVAKMKTLKTVGIQFSLDDFGTGFSSLSYLKRLPLDQLKIDRSFVSDAIEDPNAATIARTIIALGHSLGLEVIAEGVETEPQREFLAKHGCTVYQGYLFSKPLNIAALDAYLLHLHNQPVQKLTVQKS